MQLLKQSTAASVMVGPVLDGDGLPYTSATVGNFNLTKNGTTAALASPATATHSHNGHYVIAFGTGNVDTLGRLDVSVNASGYGMTLHRYTVVTANQFDALITNGTATPAAIADAVWDEAYNQHTTAGTFGKLMDILRKANNAIEATITSDVTPTATTFSVNLTAYPTSAFAGSVLMMIDGNRIDQNSPILSFTNNTTFSTIVLESPLTGVPAVGDTILIDATSHVHSIAEIVTGVWSALTSGFSVSGSAGEVVKALASMLEFVGGLWRWKASSLTQAPTGGGGSGQYAITLVASSTGGNVRGVVFSIVGTATRVETGTSGQAVVNLDAGTYTLRTTPPSGWESVADSSLVVAADATITKTLVAVGYTPSNPPGCTVTIPVRSQYTTALAGVEVKLKFISWDTGATKPATILSPPPVQTSDANGVITVVLYRQAKYTATYTIPGDTVRVVPFTVPNASTYTVVEP